MDNIPGEERKLLYLYTFVAVEQMLITTTGKAFADQLGLFKRKKTFK